MVSGELYILKKSLIRLLPIDPTLPPGGAERFFKSKHWPEQHVDKHRLLDTCVWLHVYTCVMCRSIIQCTSENDRVGAHLNVMCVLFETNTWKILIILPYSHVIFYSSFLRRILNKIFQKLERVIRNQRSWQRECVSDDGPISCQCGRGWLYLLCSGTSRPRNKDFTEGNSLQ